MIALGVMSGTSCDGVDAIAIELAHPAIPGEPTVLAHHFSPYPDDVRAALLDPPSLGIARVSELHFSLAELYAAAARELGVASAEVCGVHGQTVWHDPPSRAGARTPSTFQIGSSALVAHRLGVPVVGDLRGADIAEGGEGAPIVPFAHAFFTPPQARPRLVVNIGGIANVSVVTPELDGVLGYDLGPGMMLADAYVGRISGGARAADIDGEMSHGGAPIAAIVDRIAHHPFAALPPPKSTGREQFGVAFLDAILDGVAGASRDLLASLIEGTATLVAAAAERHGLERREILLSGGGAKNPTLVAAVRRLLPAAQVRVATSGVFLPDHHEPAAMALFAARTLRGLPSSLPRVTGARRASVLGHIHWP